MGGDGRTRIVITDANVLINMIHTKRLYLLGELHGFEFVVPDEVVAEVNVPEQAKAISSAIDAGHMERVSFKSTTDLELYTEHVQVVGKGEAACLAMAEVHGWYLASDERRRFLRLAEERLGPDRIMNTPGIYVLALRAGLMTIEQADADKQVLEKHKFKMRFKSFREVVGTVPTREKE